MTLVVLTRQRTFDPTSGEVVTGRARTRLEPQPAALLTLLAARAGRLVTHRPSSGHLQAALRVVSEPPRPAAVFPGGGTRR